MKKNKRNTVVDFWIFIFTVVIGIGFLNEYVWKGTGAKLLFTGSNYVFFFMLIAGYFLAKEIKKKKTEDVSKETFKFMGKKISKYYPTLLGGTILAFIIRNIITGTSFLDSISIFMNSLWEFLGMGSINAIGMIEQTTSEVLFNTGVTTIWNVPLLLFSAIFLGSIILYYVLNKHEDLFKFILAPLIIVFTYSTIDITTFAVQGIFIRVLAGMSVGILMYYLVEYFQKKKFSESLTMTFSIAHIILIMIFIYTWVNGIPWGSLTTGILIFAFTTIILTNKDYISVLYNDIPSFKGLSKISIYYYAYFIIFVFLLRFMYPEMGYHASIIFNFLFTTCFSVIVMYIDQYVITPLIRKK